MHMAGRSILIAGAILLGLVTAGSATAEPLKLGHSTWVGYGPLYVAQEKGYFDEEGVEVELIVMEDPKIRFPALAAGQIDVAVTTVDTMLNFLNENQSYVYLFALDDSKGGDGIVANKDIESLADLRNRTRTAGPALGDGTYLALAHRSNALGRTVPGRDLSWTHDRGDPPGALWHADATLRPCQSA